MVLPEHLVITKRLRLAHMDQKRLMLNLPYEFYDYLEHSMEEWVYDYSLADPASGEENRERDDGSSGGCSTGHER